MSTSGPVGVVDVRPALAPARRRAGLAAVGLATLAAAAVYARWDPAVTPFFPRCPLYVLTGLFCPGCGSQRALHALLHGRLGEALGHNAFAVAALPALGWFYAVRVARAFGWSLPAPAVPARATWALVAAIVAFTVLRNLPAAPFAALAP